MDWIALAAIAALSFLLGVLLVGFLVAHPLRMSVFQFLASLASLAIGLLLALAFQGAARAIAVVLSLALILLGYLTMTRRLMARPDPRPVPEITRRPGDPGDGHTAVLYFAHGEPETYNPIGWINQFREFDESGIPFVPLLARPFFIYQLRRRYLVVGKSGHRQMHHRMLASLERAYRAEGDEATRFYPCFLDDDPRPDAAAIRALNEGASRIVVAEVFLTLSNHTAEGEALIDELDIEARLGVPVVHTGPLYDSDLLKRMFVRRANAHLGGAPKERVGVLLVGHGQPDQWDTQWPSETEQEIRFRQEVIDRLVADGYREENVSMAWMEFKEPKPARKVAEFAARGVEKVLYFAAAISADAIHSQVDIPELIRRAPIPPGIARVNLGAWNDDPLVIAAIKAKVDAALAV